MNPFSRNKKPDELTELRRKVETLEAVNRAQNVRIDRLMAANDALGERIVEIEMVLANLLSPSVEAGS